MFSAGELVATRIQYKGCQVGECCGVAPTGRWVTFDALEDFRVVDGRIVESWGYWPEAQIIRMLTE
ncbi:ester cyclase [Bifidobacterium pseudolongum]|uniref:ester cyclase n=1 Tax=Bifidobacterium pseudolongum TaxID=1694 RepID=UPI001C593F25|nr:ester cyclase [Bifidobacterium pseudolongum]